MLAFARDKKQSFGFWCVPFTTYWRSQFSLCEESTEPFAKDTTGKGCEERDRESTGSPARTTNVSLFLASSFPRIARSSCRVADIARGR